MVSVIPAMVTRQCKTIILKLRVFWFAAGGEDDDRGCVHVRRLLAALSYLFPAERVLPQFVGREIHTAGLPGHHVVGHELHHVQPYHLLLPQRQVGSLWHLICV